MKIFLHRTDAGRKRNGPVSAYQIVYKEAKLVYLFQRVQNSILFIRKSFYAKFSIERFEKKMFQSLPLNMPDKLPDIFRFCTDRMSIPRHIPPSKFTYCKLCNNLILFTQPFLFYERFSYTVTTIEISIDFKLY